MNRFLDFQLLIVTHSAGAVDHARNRCLRNPCVFRYIFNRRHKKPLLPEPQDSILLRDNLLETAFMAASISDPPKGYRERNHTEIPLNTGNIRKNEAVGSFVSCHETVS
ncbi:hypothetical protein THZB04_20104 [Vibrio owensii]|nr:hypothetical protein THZB04_20104 [Vibrio owensii]